MNKKQFLRQGYKIKKRISIQEALLKEYKTNLSSLKGIDYSKDKLQGGAIPDDTLMIKKMDRILEIESRIKKLHEKLDTYQGIISEGLKGLNNCVEEMIIVNRYINNLSWEEIADNIGYSRTQTYRLHGEAIENLKLSINGIEWDF